MSTLRFVIPGSDFSAAMVGFYGQIAFPVAPYASYLLGSRFNDQGKFLDLSGNGRHLIPNAATMQGEAYATLNRTNFLQTPFTGDQLAARTSGFTLLMIARTPSGQKFAGISNYVDTNTRSSTLSLDDDVLAKVYSQDGATIASQALAQDANRGLRWGTYCGVFTRTTEQIYERHAGGSLLSSPSPAHAAQAIGGARPYVIGGDYGGAFTGQGDEALAVLFDVGLNATQVGDAADAVRAYFGHFGINT